MSDDKNHSLFVTRKKSCRAKTVANRLQLSYKKKYRPNWMCSINPIWLRWFLCVLFLEGVIILLIEKYITSVACEQNRSLADWQQAVLFFLNDILTIFSIDTTSNFFIICISYTNYLLEIKSIINELHKDLFHKF